MNINHHGCYYSVFLDGAETINTEIYQAFMQYREAPQTRRSHFFAGRYENIYLATDRLPAMTPVLQLAIDAAGEILAGQAADFRIGFWFNAMGPGHVTQPHDHDEDDELLSGSYYIRVPPESGNLLIHAGGKPHVVGPEEGKLVLFSPRLTHEVSVNRSAELRLSVGMNIGRAR